MFFPHRWPLGGHEENQHVGRVEPLDDYRAARPEDFASTNRTKRGQRVFRRVWRGEPHGWPLGGHEENQWLAHKVIPYADSSTISLAAHTSMRHVVFTEGR